MYIKLPFKIQIINFFHFIIDEIRVDTSDILG